MSTSRSKSSTRTVLSITLTECDDHDDVDDDHDVLSITLTVLSITLTECDDHDDVDDDDDVLSISLTVLSISSASPAALLLLVAA